MEPQVIFDFTNDSDLAKWLIVDDVVMGGRSSGGFTVNKDGHGQFAGIVSLENSGGFSSVRYTCGTSQINNATQVVLKIKGDGKDYQFRIKANAGDYYSYIYPFKTSGDWEEVYLPLSDMYPSFRGRKLDQPNFSHHSFEEIAFLIGNKTAEEFELLIDSIELK